MASEQAALLLRKQLKGYNTLRHKPFINFSYLDSIFIAI